MLLMRKLPFLNGIRAFEAAARLGSFAGAAEELHVTPAAISRMVHLLEERLGVVFFERKANRLALTPAGRSYQAGLSTFLEDLQAEVSASQAVMVRRLTAMVKKPELAALPSINGTTEVTTPYNQARQRENGQKVNNKPQSPS